MNLVVVVSIYCVNQPLKVTFSGMAVAQTKVILLIVRKSAYIDL